MFRQTVAAAIIGCACILAVPSRAGAAGELTAAELITRWAQAVGTADRLAAIDHVYSKSHVSTAGLEGTAEEWTTARGECRQDFNLGGMFRNLTVFDGKRGWLLDQNGKVKDLQGKELEDQITSAYFSSLSHFLPGRMSAKVELQGRDSSDNAYRLEIKPKGGKAVTVCLDAATFLPVRQERLAEDRTETSYLSDWRDESGLMVPHSVRVSSGDPKYDVHIKVETVVINGHEPEDLFVRPEEGPKDYSFEQGQAARDIPFELNSNHIYVQAKINGKGPLWFIFDTGAGATVVDAARAKALGLEMHGQIEGRGAGEGSVDVAVIPGASFALPGVALLGQTVMAIPLTQIAPYEGRPIDGILGYDLISRFVVEIDYANRKMHLYEPATYTYDGAGERIPILLEQNSPQVTAEIAVGEQEPVKGDFMIDTGARIALHLTKPFSDAHHFVDATRTISGGFGAGVGGVTKQQIGRAASLRLGSLELKNVITGFSEDAGGAMASKESAGIIGGDLLRRFRVIFDYSRHEMILEPNDALAKPFEYDMCGAFLRTAESDPTQFEIHALVDDSPARIAGLEEGDVITNVDGRPTSELTLEEMRQMFLVPDREYRLAIRRGDVGREVTVKTKRLI